MDHIEELWNGKLVPRRASAEEDTELRQLCRILERDREVIEMEGGEELLAVIENYQQAWNEYLQLSNAQAFREDFRLGTKLTVAALTDPAQ